VTSLLFPPFVFVNGNLLLLEKASLPVNDLAVLRGYGVFDFFLLKNGLPLFFEAHWARLQQSASAMNLAVPFTREDAQEMLLALYTKMPYELAGARITLTGGCSPDGYLPGDVANSLITLNPIAPFPQRLPEKGIGLMAIDYCRPFAKAKTIDYTMGIKMLPQARAKGFQELLYVQVGWVTECPRSNVFAVSREDVLITPSEGVLEGITRKRVTALASKIMKVEERPVRLQELLEAKEVFITSTTKGIWTVGNIDGHHIGDGKPGEYSTKLYEMLLEEMNIISS
jgi:branched-subunit amino acid aminotransferase/4-amino-4-deoxychorismate lyase